MQAPAFSLTAYGSDQKVSLEDFPGKNIMLTFWASWCPDCHRDIPYKQRLYESMDNDNMIMLSINVTGREGAEDDGLKFIDNHGFTFPVLRDEGTKIYDAYRCTSVPQTLLINQNQEIQYRFDEHDDFLAIFQALAKMIK